jgi:hypothetical protein
MKLFLYRLMFFEPKWAAQACDVMLRYDNLTVTDRLALHHIAMCAGSNNDLACAAIDVLAHRARPSLLLAYRVATRAQRITESDLDSNYLLLVSAIKQLGEYRGWCIRRVNFHMPLSSQHDLAIVSTLSLFDDFNISPILLMTYWPDLMHLASHSDHRINNLATSLFWRSVASLGLHFAGVGW